MHKSHIMYKITDPQDCVYYIEVISESSDGQIDPKMPFSNDDDAVNYAIHNLGLKTHEFNIIEWKVD